ncbi:MAG: DUF2283 domain-containing protein [bacterium]|nr:DUF2283 domain-containing protein [bacterium]MDP2704308.1 DUF2283 domain-containing protein [bacterium]
MKITYDKKTDALDIILKKGKVLRTIEVTPEVFVDLDGNGNLLYIEILGAREKVGAKNFEDVTIGNKVVRLSALSV